MAFYLGKKVTRRMVFHRQVILYLLKRKLQNCSPGYFSPTLGWSEQSKADISRYANFKHCKLNCAHKQFKWQRKSCQLPWKGNAKVSNYLSLECPCGVTSHQFGLHGILYSFNKTLLIQKAHLHITKMHHVHRSCYQLSET